MKAAPVETTVKNGALALKVRRYADGRYGFDFKPPGGARIKVRLLELGDAEEKARELVGVAKAGRVQRTEINEQEYSDFLRWRAEKRPSVSVGDLTSDFLSSKKRKGVSGHTLRDLKSTLTPFAKAFPGPIAELTSRSLDKWLDARDIGPRRWNNMHAAIVALHRYARRNGFLPAELTTIERMERRKVKVSVQTYSCEELRKLLAAVPTEWLPLIVLGAFAGLRPEEINPETRYHDQKQGLRWENILWDKDKIDVPAEVAKDRRRRFAPLLPVTKAWLAQWRGKSGPVVSAQRFQKIRDEWCRRAEVKWKPDGLRHSFASYRLALTQNMASLSLEMGNSAAMIHRHYLDLKDEDSAAEWFGSMPDKVPRVP
jgi:integrase